MACKMGNLASFLDEEIEAEGGKIIDSLPRKYALKFKNKLPLPKSMFLFQTYSILFVITHYKYYNKDEN